MKQMENTIDEVILFVPIVENQELIGRRQASDGPTATKAEGEQLMAITPYLYYQDVDVALKFLAKAFGFRKYGTNVRGADGKTNHAAMQLGDDLIMMGRPPSGYRNPKQLGQATQSLYVNVKDVDKHFEHARKAGAAILEEPADTEYGHRRYGATDPEGHEWYFAHEVRRPKSKRNTR
jgi:uncharacterized glyoxalase superfamily protein PhnB